MAGVPRILLCPSARVNELVVGEGAQVDERLHSLQLQHLVMIVATSKVFYAGGLYTTIAFLRRRPGRRSREHPRSAVRFTSARMQRYAATCSRKLRAVDSCKSSSRHWPSARSAPSGVSRETVLSVERYSNALLHGFCSLLFCPCLSFSSCVRLAPFKGAQLVCKAWCNIWQSRT